jgi:hypothetical protein
MTIQLLNYTPHDFVDSESAMHSEGSRRRAAVTGPQIPSCLLFTIIMARHLGRFWYRYII